MEHCPNCGAECRSGTNYCRSCGNHLDLSSHESTSVNLLYIYAHADKLFSYQLDKSLFNLQRQGVIARWEECGISTEVDLDYHLGIEIDKMQIILLLVSSDFLASNYCYGIEMKQILALHRSGSIRLLVLPLRPVELKYSLFKYLPILPLEEENIVDYADRDKGFFDTVAGIRNAIYSLQDHTSNQIVEEPVNKEAEQEESQETVDTNTMTVFCAYAPEDEELCNELKIHLNILQKQGIITDVYYREISDITSDKDNNIDPRLYSAKLILILISPDSMDGDYLYNSQDIFYAIKQQEIGKVHILPIILRSIDWRSSHFGNLQSFPSNGVAITQWRNRDAAFLDITQAIRRAASDEFLYPQTVIKANEELQDVDEVLIKPERIGSGPINVYCSFAEEDLALFEEMQKHMSGLIRKRLIIERSWTSLLPGEEKDRTRYGYLKDAQIILLLISPSFLVDTYCYDIELRRALECYETGNALIVPIILRPVDWQDTPIGRFQVLPSSSVPITLQPDRDEAFREIVVAIRQIVESLLEQSRQRTKEQCILEGQDFYRNQQYNEALNAYEQALILDQGDNLLYVTIGRLLLHLERYEEALTAYEQVLRTSPSASTYLFKGLILQRLGRSADALLAYQQARTYGYSS